MCCQKRWSSVGATREPIASNGNDRPTETNQPKIRNSHSQPPDPMVHSDEDEEGRSLTHGNTTADSKPWAAEWSVGDWLATAALWVLGTWADKWPPFENDLKPQLHDSAISYPHKPAELQAVPAWLLWRYGCWLPAGALVCVAYVVVPAHSLVRERQRARLLAELWLGLCSSVGCAFAFVCLVKAQVGRLRPDFLARCMPVDGACTGDALVVEEGRRSFPSGHSAISFSGLAYLTLVLLACVWHTPTPRAGTLWKTIFVSLPWLLALWIALTRLQDHWHHWQDVLVGSLIGHVAAYACFRLRFYPVSTGAGLTPHSFLLTGEKQRISPLEPLSPA